MPCSCDRRGMWDHRENVIIVLFNKMVWFWKMQIEDYLYQKKVHEPLAKSIPVGIKAEDWTLLDRQVVGVVSWFYEMEEGALRLVPNPTLPTPYVPPTKKDWDTLFQLMFDDYFNPTPSVASPVPAVVSPIPADSTGLPSSTLVNQDAPSPSSLQTPQASQYPVASPGVVEEFHDIEVAHLNNNPFFCFPIPE
ncbi:hypothetical protein Tco_0139304 [Tanacetum coccineum]